MYLFPLALIFCKSGCPKGPFSSDPVLCTALPLRFVEVMVLWL